MTATPTAGLWPAARLALGTACALGLARFAYGLLLPAMRDDLHWTLAAAGAVATANGFGYLLGALVTRILIHRLGAATAFRLAMALTTTSLALTAVSGDYLTLLALRTLSGATGAVVFVAGGVLASRLAADAASATPITVYFAGAGLGIVLSGVAVPLLGEHWRLAWVALGAAAALATAVSWTGASSGAGPSSAGRARLRQLLAPALAYLLFAAGYITYITFLSAYLAGHEASVGQVVLTWAVLGTAVAAAPAVWSRPIARWPGNRALTTLLVVLSGGAALMLVSSAMPLVLLSVLLYGASFMGVPAAVTALVRARTAAGDWAATLGVLTAVFAAGQTAGPWLAGLIADHTSTTATLAWTAVLCAVAAVIALVGDLRCPTTTHDQHKEQDHGQRRTRPRDVPRRVVLRAAHPPATRRGTHGPSADVDRPQ
ncbi:YbfB/YjiJ family MFS transporter [Micromonospora chaiyaphumensis]|uniref:Predicted arabinose efflux permease, MFS family n=1 Tax=Micromonospora chaiyaphumensis TaxID=307119 RepID=A0A1C4W9S3_9ACTN|nr:YbfB/YjiJ family MFS transporter [Micromonospora chaiyaphumensis]SCE92977.1 Predicted arabinose efflux permease, MFS family [Micromonospora chaiyaphumensis]